MKTIKIPPYTELRTPAVQETFLSIPKKTLFCLPLRTGCLVMGYVSLILTIVEVLVNVGIIIIGSYYYANEDSVTSLGYIVPLLILIFIPLIVFSVLWVKISIVGIIGIHKDRPVHIRLFTKFISSRLLYTLLINIYGTFFSGLITQYVALITLGTVVSTYYLLMCYWYTAELDSNRKTKNEPNSEKASKPYYLPDYIVSNHDDMKFMV